MEVRIDYEKNNRFFMQCFLILILVTVITIPAFSQEIRFDHFSVKEGLSQGNILEIHQDKFTFLWIGTEDGLNLVDAARMTITGHHLLNKAVARSGNLIASEILNRLNEDIISELHQNAPNIQFGMDVSLCVFNQFKSKLQFAGANQPLYIVRDASLIQIKPNNFSIGPDIKGRIHNFSNNEIDLMEGDGLYLFTDGFADQFGGEDGTKKFLYSKFRELLVNVEKETMENQSLLIEKKLAAWKGNIDQVDDILVIGLKI